jgi:hypothetical protein
VKVSVLFGVPVRVGVPVAVFVPFGLAVFEYVGVEVAVAV